jgi:hypothetical protein
MGRRSQATMVRFALKFRPRSPGVPLPSLAEPGQSKIKWRQGLTAESPVVSDGLATDAFMATRILRCAIEQIVDWHAHLFVDPHVVAFVAVASRYSRSPAFFDVACDNITSRWLGMATECRLEVS